MTYLKLAYLEEKIDNAVAASGFYRKAFQNGEGAFDDFINAAVLMIGCQDPGYISSQSLGSSFLEEAWENITVYLHYAENEVVGNLETKFWAKYNAYINLGESPFLEECIMWFEAGLNEALLVLLPNGYSSESLFSRARAFYHENEAGLTYRQRYICSVLESYLPN